MILKIGKDKITTDGEVTVYLKDGRTMIINDQRTAFAYIDINDVKAIIVNKKHSFGKGIYN